MDVTSERNRTVFRTLNSVYELDREHGWWKRLTNDGDVDPDAPLRDEEGTMLAHSAVRVGEPVVIFGPPRDLVALGGGVALRMITSSPVVSIITGSTDDWGLGHDT